MRVNFAGHKWQRWFWGIAGLFPRWDLILEMLPAFVNSTISPLTETKGEAAAPLGEARAEDLLSDIVKGEVRVKSNLENRRWWWWWKEMNKRRLLVAHLYIVSRAR